MTGGISNVLLMTITDSKIEDAVVRNVLQTKLGYEVTQLDHAER